MLNPGETPCNCPEDAGPPDPFETDCEDGIDNDCDGFIDCADSECGGPSCPSQICLDGNSNWITADGGCMDLQTGLVWSLETSNRTWNFATQYAADLVEGGFSDWRLPTKSELETAAANLASGQLPGAGFSWSSTKNRNEIWWVDSGLDRAARRRKPPVFLSTASASLSLERSVHLRQAHLL